MTPQLFATAQRKALFDGSATRRTSDAAAVPLRISPKRVLRVLLALVVVVTCASFALHMLYRYTGLNLPLGLVHRFDVDQENNLPTWFSSLNLVVVAALLFLVTRSKVARRDSQALYWGGLCALFLALSIDETASLHEATVWPIQRMLNTTGALYTAWVIPGMIAVALFAVLYLRFFFALPRRFQALFALAGAMYVGGALGVEMVSWAYRYPLHMQTPNDFEASRDFVYLVIVHFEELLEMVGVVTFVYALLAYLSWQQPRLGVAFDERCRPSPQR